MSAQVVAFLHALYIALHSSCLVESAHVSLGAPVPTVHVDYGGNCWQATLTWLASPGSWLVSFPVAG